PSPLCTGSLGARSLCLGTRESLGPCGPGGMLRDRSPMQTLPWAGMSCTQEPAQGRQGEVQKRAMSAVPLLPEDGATPRMNKRKDGSSRATAQRNGLCLRKVFEVAGCGNKALVGHGGGRTAASPLQQSQSRLCASHVWKQALALLKATAGQ